MRTASSGNVLSNYRASGDPTADQHCFGPYFPSQQSLHHGHSTISQATHRTPTSTPLSTGTRPLASGTDRPLPSLTELGLHKYITDYNSSSANAPSRTLFGTSSSSFDAPPVPAPASVPRVEVQEGGNVAQFQPTDQDKKLYFCPFDECAKRTGARLTIHILHLVSTVHNIAAFKCEAQTCSWCGAPTSSLQTALDHFSPHPKIRETGTPPSNCFAFKDEYTFSDCTDPSPQQARRYWTVKFKKGWTWLEGARRRFDKSRDDYELVREKLGIIGDPPELGLIFKSYVYELR